MKFIYLYIIITLVLAVLYISYDTVWNSSIIYKPNKRWVFVVTNSENTATDTITLTVLEKIKFNFQREIEWLHSPRLDSITKNITTTSENTGVVDETVKYLPNFIHQSKVWIHPPRSLYMRYAELVHFPYIEFPIKIGNSHKWELTPQGSGWKELEGLNVDGEIVVANKIYYDNPQVKDTCWVLEAKGKVKDKVYYGTYYFSEKLGFVYLKYKFDVKTIEMNLINYQ